MMPILRAATLLGLILFATVRVAPAAAEPPTTSSDLVALSHQVVELVNQERLKAGLLPLQWNDSLAASAVAYAQDMAARNYFAHNSPEGSTPVERARSAGYEAYGWGGLYVGENLARGFPEPEGAMQGWMASEGHRNNLLNQKYRETGVGVAVAPNGARVWAQEFGSRPRVLPIFINGDTRTTDFPRVSLSLSSEEVSNWGSVGRVTEMMISNSPDFAGSSWEPFSRTKIWMLSGAPGLQRVYVRLRDAGGTVVESSQEIRMVGHQAMGVTEAQSTEVAAGPQPVPVFRLGFRLLADLIPDLVGDPVSFEQWQVNGDAIQWTTRGMMQWRSAQNNSAFTDGFRTWVNGPFGLQERENGEQFTWER